ncbi:hypothetical protein ED733_005407 [Metarhizium rileyi]|uniref:Uncharacterized protein n=1 Tax=Metarhizium rileyi (strain RCEF 4871) TaxID=1649241 RepID=A0A5C6GL90_METRR|nr:hypothetical protein ED733_005407 [Metarhizium rileyi]
MTNTWHNIKKSPAEGVHFGQQPPDDVARVCRRDTFAEGVGYVLSTVYTSIHPESIETLRTV